MERGIDQAAFVGLRGEPATAPAAEVRVGDDWMRVRPKEQEARARQSHGGEIVQTPIGRVITERGMWVIVLENGDRWIAPPDGFRAFWVLEREASDPDEA